MTRPSPSRVALWEPKALAEARPDRQAGINPGSLTLTRSHRGAQHQEHHMLKNLMVISHGEIAQFSTASFRCRKWRLLSSTDYIKLDSNTSSVFSTFRTETEQ